MDDALDRGLVREVFSWANMRMNALAAGQTR